MFYELVEVLQQCAQRTLLIDKETASRARMASKSYACIAIQMCILLFCILLDAAAAFAHITPVISEAVLLLLLSISCSMSSHPHCAGTSTLTHEPAAIGHVEVLVQQLQYCWPASVRCAAPSLLQVP